jgi:outer membrane protein assembly factor BamB
LLTVALTGTALSLGTGGGSSSAVAGTQVDWNAYLGGPTHPSVTSDTGITETDVPTLTEAWHWTPPAATQPGQPAAGIFGTPTVVGSVIYVGSNTGWFYALSLSTGRQIWSQFLGYLPDYTCSARGISATAAVAPDPVTGTPMVYAPGGDGYLYALDAATGDVLWKSVIALPTPDRNDYYNWSSPTLLDGRIYVGRTSQCDSPLTQGGLREFDQHTGAVLATYNAVPDGVVGGGVWSSAAANTNGVYVTTGTPPPHGIPAGTDSVSVVRLDPITLARQEGWAVTLNPPGKDQDFGASPVIFTANLAGVPTEMVGAMNKNGTFYAWKSHDLAAGPVWSVQVDNPVVPSIPAAVYDGTHLWVSGNKTTIDGMTYRGSIRELDPDTGAILWETGLAGAVLGTPSLNGSGILAVPIYDYGTGVPNGVYLIDGSTGDILRFIQIDKGQEFSQPIWVGNTLLLGTIRRGLFALRPSTQVFADDFDTGDLGKWTTSRNTTVESSDTAQGAYAADAVSAGSAAYLETSFTPTNDLTMVMSFKLVSKGSTAMTLLSFRDGSTNLGKPIYTVSINAAGKLVAHNAVSGITRSGPIVSIATWHTISVHLLDTASGQTSVTLDGVRLTPPSSDFETFGTASAVKLLIGDPIPSHTFDLRVDQVAVETP